MSIGAYPAARSARIQSKSSRPPLWSLLIAGGWCLLLLGAVATGAVLSRIPLPASLAIVGCLSILLGLGLVVARYELAVTVALLLSAVVVVEPAPTDALFGLLMAVAAATGRFGLKRLPRPALWIVFSFVALNILSLMDVLSWSAAARFFLITFYLAMFSLWTAAYVDRPDRARRVVRAYLAAAVFSAIASSLALFGHFPGASTFIGDQSRAKGLFKDPNVFGPFLIPIAVILAEEILRPRLLRMRRPLMFACFLALTVGVVLIGIVVLRRPDRRALSLVAVVLLSGVAIVGVVIGTGSLGFLEERARVHEYDTSRFAAQLRGLSVGVQHPFGIGPGQFDVVSPVSSHSLYVRALSEQGALGLLLIALLILGTTSLAVMSVIRGRDTYGISAAALLAAWCGLTASSFFVDTLHWRHLWLVAALIWAGAARQTGRSTHLRTSRASPGAQATYVGAAARGPRSM
jgi:O-Antigen ligase